MTRRKKLIEVALPLDAINAAAAREKSIRHGHPSTLHLWWARRPLAAARAVIFAQMVDDPSSRPELFPTEQEQDAERRRLFDLIEKLVRWENTANEELLHQAREKIRSSWRRTCADHADHPRAAELFNPERLPAFHDPFAGGGALPLEAQRLGLEAHASDLNPVAVLINKAMIEIPPKFAGRPPVNPESRSDEALVAGGEWKGARGLAEDIRYYGRRMRDEAERRIGHLYPKITVTDEMVRERPDLRRYAERELTVIAWLWARTVRSPNPAFGTVEVPLISTYMLSTKKGKEAYVEPVVDTDRYRFTVKVGPPPASAKAGTGAGKRHGFYCLVSSVPITYDYIRGEGQAGRMGARLMAIVAEGDRGRVYLAPTAEHEEAARKAQPEWQPDLRLEGKSRQSVSNYGIDTVGDLFTPRQLVALTTFCDLVTEARDRIRQDATAAGVPNDGRPLHAGGNLATAYADGLATYLAFALSRMVNYSATLCVWSSHAKDELAKQVFLRQALAMTWDFAETNPFSSAGGTFSVNIDYLKNAVSRLPGVTSGAAEQIDATHDIVANHVVSTDPPYYDNIGYADLSDFFYVWLRRSLRPLFPDLFVTLVAPKADELVATPYRHESKSAAEAFFLDGMTTALRRLAELAHRGLPVTIYYAFKQSETRDATGTISTGWETFLSAVIRSGFAITGIWPLRTELITNLKKRSNALASSIVLVCRRRPADAPRATRRNLRDALEAELPAALIHLQRANIAPVDLAQAAIGPGMAIFTRYAAVLDPNDGRRITVREALSFINKALDEILTAQEGSFDTDSRWALAWFDQHGFEAGEYGSAETLATAKNTSVNGMVRVGIIHAQAGRVRLLRPRELPADWDPAADDRLTTWEVVHHMIRALEQLGEVKTAALLRRLGSAAAGARELCYRLYTICERKQRAAEALDYNGLVQAWPELRNLSLSDELMHQAEMALNAD